MSVCIRKALVIKLTKFFLKLWTHLLECDSNLSPFVFPHLRYVCVCVFNRVWPFVTSWTVVHQASLDTGMGCHFLLQGNLPDPVSNLNFLCVLHWQADSLWAYHGMVAKTSLSRLNWLPQNSQSLTYFSNTCISLSEGKKMSAHNILDPELYHIHLRESSFGTVSVYGDWSRGITCVHVCVWWETDGWLFGSVMVCESVRQSGCRLLWKNTVMSLPTSVMRRAA